jgi:hypothetical protein
MQVGFFAPDDPETLVATAVWDGRSVEVESQDDALRAALTRAYRPTPVVVDDAAYRRLGTSGEVMVQPGSLEWFRVATQVRAQATGLVARFVPGVTEGGFDPAAQYRSFEDAIERLTAGPA